MFDKDTVSSIMNIDLSDDCVEDEVFWMLNANGKRSVESFYLADQKERFSINNRSLVPWKTPWKPKLHERIEIFL